MPLSNLALYARFDEAFQRACAADDRRHMPYEGDPFPDRLYAGWWMAYAMMRDEFARELANIINKLSDHVTRLKAWSQVVSTLGDVEKMEACMIAIDDLATISLNLPHVIRSRFIFAGAQLSHQANQALPNLTWVDDLPLDHEIYQPTLDPLLRPWKRSGVRFRRAIEDLANSAYKDATGDFRNAYNHRFSRRFVIGMTQTIRRIPRNGGGFCYGFGGDAPFQLDDVVRLLVHQRDASYRAFDAFRWLVAAHVAAIVPINAEQLAEIERT